MSNYTKSTNFTAKDSLSSGNAGKIIKGSEFDTEFNAVAVAVATKIDDGGTATNLTLSSPVLTGTMTGTGIISGGTFDGS